MFVFCACNYPDSSGSSPLPLYPRCWPSQYCKAGPVKEPTYFGRCCYDSWALLSVHGLNIRTCCCSPSGMVDIALQVMVSLVNMSKGFQNDLSGCFVNTDIHELGPVCVTCFDRPRRLFTSKSSRSNHKC